MAASDSRPIPRKNQAFRVTFPIFDADGDLVTGAAGLDSEESIDGGTFTDCTNEATEIATSSGMYFLDLTAGEMNGDTVVVIVKTSTSGAKTTPIVLYPEEAGDVRAAVVSIADNAITASAIASDAITDAKVASDVTIASVTGAVGSVTGNVGGNVVGSVASVVGAVGSVTGNLGGNVVGSVASVTAPVTVGTNSDKTGYSLSTTPPTAAQIRTEMDSNSTQLAKLGTPAGASMSADIAAVKSDTAATLLDTGTDGVVVASASKTGYSLAADQSGVTVGTVNALGTQAKADVNAEADTALADAGVTTTVTGRIDAAVSTRATPAQVATELGTYDAPTKAELDSAVASLATASALTTVGNNVSSILADTGTDGVVLSTAQMQSLADIVLGRSGSNVDNTASTHSLYELIQAILESSTATGSWVIKKTDGSTTFNTRTVVTDAEALPIVGVS